MLEMRKKPRRDPGLESSGTVIILGPLKRNKYLDKDVPTQRVYSLNLLNADL